MRTILTLLIVYPLYLAAQTGRSIKGPPTMEHPSYPNSGSQRNRSNDMTGKGMSNSSLMGSDVDPSVPTRNPTRSKQEQEEETSSGPYKDGIYQHHKKE